jgi:hypothetical protein
MEDNDDGSWLQVLYTVLTIHCTHHTLAGSLCTHWLQGPAKEMVVFNPEGSDDAPGAGELTAPSAVISPLSGLQVQ